VDKLQFVPRAAEYDMRTSITPEQSRAEEYSSHVTATFRHHHWNTPFWHLSQTEIFAHDTVGSFSLPVGPPPGRKLLLTLDSSSSAEVRMAYQQWCPGSNKISCANIFLSLRFLFWISYHQLLLPVSLLRFDFASLCFYFISLSPDHIRLRLNFFLRSFMNFRSKVFAGFEALTDVLMRNSIFWDKTPCTPLKVSSLFGDIYLFHLQGWILNQARDQYGADKKQDWWILKLM
jgi:hypothetical protein